MNDESWDGKRGEVWKRIVDLEAAVKENRELVGKFSSTLTAVEELAKNKISENEANAIEIVKSLKSHQVEAAKILAECQGFVSEINPLRESIKPFKRLAPRIDQLAKVADEETAKLHQILVECEKLNEDVVTLHRTAKQSSEDAAAKWTTLNQQGKDISDIAARVQDKASEILTLADKSTRNEKNIATILAKAESDLTELYNVNKSKHEKLLATHDEVLNKLQHDHARRCHELEEQIEALLPGATSAGLATAFSSRRQTYEKAQKWWVGLVIIATILFGFIGIPALLKMASGELSVTMLLGRTLCVAACVLLEEFGRRNYNIAARLTEAYAYKEALAKSYTGYQKLMGKTKIPHTASAADDIMGDQILMQDLLGTLRDEPGKTIFDKEKQYLGPTKIVEDLKHALGPADQRNIQLSQTTFLEHVNWRAVVVVGIVAFVVCIMAILFRSSLPNIIKVS